MTRILLVLVLATQLVIPQSTWACTGIILRSLDGATIAARTLEFGFDIKSNIVVVPPGTDITTLAWDPNNQGFTYQAKYGFAGANCLDKPVVVDGINEKGLYFGAFYFAGNALFETVNSGNKDRAISSEELGNWILSQFATIEELKTALPKQVIVGTYIDAIKGVAPFHYAVTDATGASVVIEYTKDGLQIFDNDVNAVTNNPPFDWHKTNLQNYVGLSPVNREPITAGGQELKPFGQGSGMLGLPGDYSSPSRFVRAVAFANTSVPAADASQAVFNAFHILNAFDIPKGAIREADNNSLMDYTIWTSASDTRNATYYYKTFKSQSVECINVRQAIAGLDAPRVLPMETGFVVRDRTKELRK